MTHQSSVPVSSVVVKLNDSEGKGAAKRNVVPFERGLLHEKQPSVIPPSGGLNVDVFTMRTKLAEKRDGTRMIKSIRDSPNSPSSRRGLGHRAGLPSFAALTEPGGEMLLHSSLREEHGLRKAGERAQGREVNERLRI